MKLFFKSFLFLAILSLSFAIVGCGGSGGSGGSSGVSTGTIRGNVQNTDGDGITTATVTDGSGNSVDTGAAGAFTLEDARIESDGRVRLTITANNHLTTYAFESLEPDATVRATYRLREIAAENTETYTNLIASDTDVEPVAGRAKIEFAAGTIVDADGDPVDEADITVVHVMPEADKADNPLDTFPGIFAGLELDDAGNLTDNEVPFETFGFVNVDLDGNQLKEGSVATITMPIDPDMLAEAPDEMPFWNFDESDGKWKQTGVATRVGDNYVVTVEHFSWYNLDRPVDTDRLEVTVASYTLDVDLDPDDYLEQDEANRDDLSLRISGARVVVRAALQESAAGELWEMVPSNTPTWQDVGTTDGNGVVSFRIPEGRRISVEVTCPEGETAEGHGYEMEDGVAKVFVNFGDYGCFQER